MINIFKKSENLYFEPLEEKHLSDEYVSWLNDEEVIKYNSHGVYPNNYEKTKSYIQSVQSNLSTVVLALIEKESNKHIGNASIRSIDLINSNADLAILIGDKSAWGKGYGTEAFDVLIKHCFNNLNLHRVTAGTTQDNIGMQKILEKLGFQREGLLREVIKRDGKFLDIYYYGLLNKK